MGSTTETVKEVSERDGKTTDRPISRIVLVVLALAGLGVSLYLTNFHFKILSDANYESFCSINATFDCDKVNSSPWAKLWGIPLGLYGAGFYSVILALSAFTFSRKDKHAGAPQLIFGLSFLAVVLSLGLAYISAVEIGAWCILCVSLYIINILLLVFSYRVSGGGLRAIVRALDHELAAFYRSPLIYTSVLLFLGVSLIGGGVYRDRVKAAEREAAASFAKKATARKERAAHPDAVSKRLEAQEKPAGSLLDEVKPLEIFGTEFVKGNPDAPVQIAIFSDFQCPYCKVAAYALDEVLERFPDDVLIIYKQYPLDMKCNPNLQRPMHEYSCDAAAAAICAGRQNRFWKMHDLLFSDQHRMSASDIQGYAEQLNLNMSAFNTCLKDREVALEIFKDLEEGRTLGIRGTPTIYINQRQWTGPVSPDAISSVVEELLARQ